MSNYYTLLTAIGAAEFINAKAANTTVPFTHLALGDGNGASVVPAEGMTGLVREVHRVPISSVTRDIDNPNWLVIEAVVPTSVGGWTVREIGLIGGSGAGNKLLAAGNFPATYKPLLAEGSGRDLVVRMIVQVGNASVVQLTVDPAVVLATNQAIVNAVAAHEAKPDPHAQYLTTPRADERYVRLSQRGVAGGVATLGSDGLVPLAQLPPAIATDAELAAALAAHVDPAGHPHAQYITRAQLAAAFAGRRGHNYFLGQL